MYEYIYEMFKKIKNIYGTDPNIIKNTIDVTYKEYDMGDMYGLYMRKSKKKCAIAINEKLQGWEKKFTQLHELSHHFFEHKGRIFYNYGYISRQREEFQADLLATLLFLDNEGLDIYNLKTFENIIIPDKIRFYINVILQR